jgi:hypothetical protein
MDAVSSEVGVDVVATFISTIISVIISSLVAFKTAKVTLRYQERQSLDELITKIIEISIEYPYLEDDEYCAKWADVIVRDELAMRYDYYCCIVFNLIERVWRYCKGNKKKINDMLYVEELVNRHYQWWITEDNNSVAYSNKFQNYIINFKK